MDDETEQRRRIAAAGSDDRSVAEAQAGKRGALMTKGIVRWKIGSARLDRIRATGGPLLLRKAHTGRLGPR